MSNQTVDDLVNRALDGEASPEEQARLRTLLASDPAARALYEDLSSVFSILRDAPPLQPPPQWQTTLRRALAASSPRPGGVARVRHALAAGLRRLASPKLVPAFVAGVLAGIAILAALRPNLRFDEAALNGTLLSAEHIGATRTIDEQRLEFPSGRATIRTRGSDGSVVVDLEVDSSAPVEVAVVFDTRALVPLAMERQPGTTTAPTLDSTGLAFRGQGRQSARLVLRRASDPAVDLRLRVRVAGEPDWRETVARTGP
jgi:hypothetical protein